MPTRFVHGTPQSLSHDRDLFAGTNSTWKSILITTYIILALLTHLKWNCKNCEYSICEIYHMSFVRIDKNAANMLTAIPTKTSDIEVCADHYHSLNIWNQMQ